MRATKRDNSQNRVDDQPSISPQMVREAEAIFHDHLRRVGLKHTGQRDTILRAFLDTRDHLSTDELFRLVRKKDERIGFTTVYRTLKLLAECGLASEVAFNDGDLAIRTPVQPSQPPSHGLHRMLAAQWSSSRTKSSASSTKSAASTSTSPRDTPSRSTAFAKAARKSANVRSPDESFCAHAELMRLN